MSIPYYPFAQTLVPDGVMLSFTLTAPPAVNSLLVIHNGLVLAMGSDYTLTRDVITFGVAPGIGDQLVAYYTAESQTPFSGGPGGIAFDPEVISTALFILLGQSVYPFAAMDRRGKIWGDVNVAQQPYLALIEVGATGVQDSAIGLEKWTLHYLILVYLRVDENPATTPATQINAALKAIIDVMNSSPIGQKQTLGGLVNNAWINGRVSIDTGILDQQCALLIPVDVQTGL